MVLQLEASLFELSEIREAIKSQIKKFESEKKTFEKKGLVNSALVLEYRINDLKKAYNKFYHKDLNEY